MRSILASLGVLALLVSGSGTASATTGGCFLPLSACDIYAENFFDGTDLSSDPKTCERQCREFHEACLKVCKQTKECLEVAVTGATRGETQECNELEGSDRQECKQTVTENVSDFWEFLGLQRQECKDCCESVYQGCLDDCPHP
jgi:hypothetical protein